MSILYIYLVLYFLIMGQNIYSDPAHNIACGRRFTCGKARCPADKIVSKQLQCYVEKFSRYQPDSDTSDSDIWHKKEWKEINAISWGNIFSFENPMISILFIIFLFLFISYVLLTFYKII
jgi:hypothetical protein